MRKLALTLTLLLACGALAAEEEVTVTIDQVPAAVKATILKAAGDRKVEKIEQETKKGVVVYAAEWTDKDGVSEVEVKVAADGTLLKTEREAKDGKGSKDDDKDEKGEHGEKGK